MEKRLLYPFLNNSKNRIEKCFFYYNKLKSHFVKTSEGQKK